MFGVALLATLFTVIHSSDGGVDDFATTALIAAVQEKSNEFDFPAVIITNADCEPYSALSGYRKMAKLLNLSTAVGLSSSCVWNQFPWIWRMDSEKVDQLPIFKKNKAKKNQKVFEGDALFIKALKKAEKVKIIATGPLKTLSDVFRAHPKLMTKVSELHWMGGAIDVPGNLLEAPEFPQKLLNDKAEWNVFCDPESADWIFKHAPFAIHLYPIDLSNLTIPNDFMAILNQKNQTPYSEFVGACYKLVEQAELYRMWDVVAAAGVLFPEVFEAPVKEKLRVIVSGKDEGAIVRDEKGREVEVYLTFKNGSPQAFYEATANALSHSKSN